MNGSKGEVDLNTGISSIPDNEHQIYGKVNIID